MVSLPILSAGFTLAPSTELYPDNLRCSCISVAMDRPFGIQDGDISIQVTPFQTNPILS
jgi:hypothetical protein